MIDVHFDSDSEGSATYQQNDTDIAIRKFPDRIEVTVNGEYRVITEHGFHVFDAGYWVNWTNED